MKKVYEEAIANVIWLFFPGLILFLVLLAIGEADSLIGSPEIALLSAVAFGQSISNFNNVRKDDVWAYNLFAIMFFAGTLLLGTLLAINKHTATPILSSDFPLIIANSAAVIVSITFLFISKLFKKQYNVQQP